MKKIVFPEFMTLKQIAAAFGLGTSTAWRYSNAPDFPEPFYFSASRKVWLATEVLDWFMNRRGRRPS